MRPWALPRLPTPAYSRFAAYKDFLRLWKEVEPEIPILKEARTSAKFFAGKRSDGQKREHGPVLT
jgi:hypothetical protein